MGELGLTAAPFPEAVGGAGFSYLGWSLVMEEVARADMASAVCLSVHILSQYPVVTWGTLEQRERWLRPMQSGELLGAFALTEPHAGSDAAAIRTCAVRVDGDGEALPLDAPLTRVAGYRLEGTKIWISNAPEAERYLVFATLDPARRAKGIGAFLVEKGTIGFRFGSKERKMGIRACPAAELIFEGAVVPAANRLGAEGQGCGPAVWREWLLTGHGPGAAHARCEGRPDLRGHQPDSPVDRRRRGPAPPRPRLSSPRRP